MRHQYIFIPILCLYSIYSNAQYSYRVYNESTLSIEGDALSLNINYSRQADKKLSYGFGIGLGQSQVFLKNKRASGFPANEILSGQLFIGNNPDKEGFFWEVGYSTSLTIEKSCQEYCLGTFTQGYFKPYYSGEYLKIGTQIGISFDDDEVTFVWTPIILRYDFHFKNKKKRKRVQVQPRIYPYY